MSEEGLRGVGARIEREIDALRAQREQLERAPQAEIPDDLKADADLSLDMRGALDAIRHAAYNSEMVSRRVVDAVDRLIAALAKEATE